MLNTEFIFRDRVFGDDDRKPSTEALEVTSGGSRLYGYTLLPGGRKDEKHPCVIMLHGFPGHTTNHDVLQCLRRIGCVAVNPFFRGAWGSEGFYTFSGLPEDACAVAEWLRSDETAEKYSIDTDNMFIVGHSMGGFACINAMRRLNWIKGGVCMAPYDMPWFFENEKVDSFAALLPIGSCLRQESQTSLMENAQSCWKEMAFSQAFDDLKDRNICFVGGKNDAVAPPEDMIFPLWNRLAAHAANAVQECCMIDSDHSFNDSRIALCETVCRLIAKMAQ
ncbi:MAG: alpha/beta hydrolase [Pyramidobacter sp.]|nr:alpha/beta hydrolase [Pyramidobacter sp.]